jgi:hypothetical protein
LLQLQPDPSQSHNTYNIKLKSRSKEEFSSPPPGPGNPTEAEREESQAFLSPLSPYLIKLTSLQEESTLLLVRIRREDKHVYLSTYNIQDAASHHIVVSTAQFLSNLYLYYRNT